MGGRDCGRDNGGMQSHITGIRSFNASDSSVCLPTGMAALVLVSAAARDLINFYSACVGRSIGFTSSPFGRPIAFHTAATGNPIFSLHYVSQSG